MNREAVNRWVLLLVVIFISALFLSMIRDFLLAIFLAGLFTALARPIYQRFQRWFGGRRALSSIVTLVLIVFLFLLPLSGLLGILTAQAVKVGQAARPWVERQISEPGSLSEFLRALPFYDSLEPYKEEILKKAGQAVGHISNFLINSLSSATMGTVNFVFTVFVLLYTMFFFLMDGHRLLERILYYLPLESKDEEILLDRFTSVARATLKGTAVIGILQGGLAGAAFAVVGIPSSVFWGTLMAVLSIIPGVGTALVWAPAAVVLAAGGHYLKAAGLTVFCAVAVGSVDNLLRPALVGKDTQLHELMIFFGTLGGIVMFGVMGIVIGPIIAALFVSVWEIYGKVFADILPESPPFNRKERTEDPEASSPSDS